MQSYVSTLKRGFAWKNVGLQNAKSENFSRSQWPVHPLIYVAYRNILAMYCFIWLVISIVRGGGMIQAGGQELVQKMVELAEDAENTAALPNTTIQQNTGDLYMKRQPLWWWLLFLTNWTFTIFCLYLTCAAVNVTMMYISHRESTYAGTWDAPSETLPWTCKIHWVLYNINCTLNFIVCFGYWGLIIPFDEKHRRDINMVSIHCHLVNGIVMLIEFMVVNIRLKLPHVFHGLSVAGIYVIFSAIYWAAGGKPFPIYGFLNYQYYPLSTTGIIAALGGIIFPIFWFLACGLTKLRLSIYRTYFSDDSKSELSMKNII